MSVPTEITVRPTGFPQREEPIFGVRTPGDTDSVSIDDIARGLNPLHHIPFVSQVYEAATGNTGSAAAKLIGGALIGGPIGFLVSLAGVIFEQETGTTMLASASNAIFGESTTQVASVETKTGPVEIASLRGVETPTQEILPPAPDKMAGLATQAAQQAQMQMASSMAQVGKPYDSKDAEVLALFGGQAPSAHQSYQKAQMLSYLQDVTTSQVI